MPNVIKFSGEKEPYSEKKVYSSARRAGASKEIAERAVEKINKEIYEGMKTSKILDEINILLKEKDKKTALKFNLKKAIKRLGPTGFPFEKYVAEIFRKQGYKTKVSLFLKGKCCSHETDFVAEKDNILYIGECKYKNLRGGKVHTSDVLANHARFLDLQKSKKDVSILVTNGKFTSKASKYSKCVGMELLGWRHPIGKGLEKMIEDKKLYPVTTLSSISKKDLDFLIENQIMLAEDLLKGHYNLPKKVIEEAKILLE